MYLQQYGKYLEVDLISSKLTNRKQEKISCLNRESNPGLFSPVSPALPSEPSHLAALHKYYTSAFKLVICIAISNSKSIPKYFCWEVDQVYQVKKEVALQEFAQEFPNLNLGVAR